MVGKLFLDLGEDYAFDIRRARQVAEGIAPLPGDKVVTFGGITLAIDGLPANSFTLTVTGTVTAAAAGTFRVTWDNFGTIVDETANFSWPSAGQTADDIAAIVAAAIDSDTSLVVTGPVGGVITLARPNAGVVADAVLTLGPGQGQVQDPLQPGDESDKQASPHGADYWLRVRPNGRWQVGWNIDSDPDADVWQRLANFVNDGSVDPDYRADVRAYAMQRGWNGAD